MSVNDLLSIIEKFKVPFEIEYTAGTKEDIPKIVLNIDKLTSIINLKLTSIEEGIVQTYIELTHKEFN